MDFRGDGVRVLDALAAYGQYRRWLRVCCKMYSSVCVCVFVGLGMRMGECESVQCSKGGVARLDLWLRMPCEGLRSV